MLDELDALLMSNVVDKARATVLCCRKKDAAHISADRLQTCLGDDVLFFGVDKHGSVRTVNKVANEFPELDEAESDDAKVYYDEHDRRRSLFSSMAGVPIFRCRKNAKVIFTHKLPGVPSGAAGEIIGFSAANAGWCDAMNAARERFYAADRDQILRDWRGVQPGSTWPIVRFALNGVRTTKTIMPVRFTVDDANGDFICSRTQVPLMLAYALTVHKAQGITSHSVVFHLDGLFAAGQLYTALSRVRDFSRLAVTGNVSSAAQCADKQAIEWDKSVSWHVIDNSPPWLDVTH